MCFPVLWCLMVAITRVNRASSSQSFLKSGLHIWSAVERSHFGAKPVPAYKWPMMVYLSNMLNRKWNNTFIHYAKIWEALSVSLQSCNCTLRPVLGWPVHYSTYTTYFSLSLCSGSFPRCRSRLHRPFFFLLFPAFFSHTICHLRTLIRPKCQRNGETSKNTLKKRRSHCTDARNGDSLDGICDGKFNIITLARSSCLFLVFPASPTCG